VSEVSVRVSRSDLVVIRERLSERDRRILEVVGELRLLGARQVQALLFPDAEHATPATAARCCRRVLKRLSSDRLLVRLERRVGGIRSGSASYVYALGQLGQRVLDREGPRRRLGEPSERFVDHTLAIAEFFVQISIEARAETWELLEWQGEPGSWREVTTLGGPIVLRPDLYFVLGVGEFELRWFVEIDRNTEHLPAITRKCRLYHSYYKNGEEQRRHRVFPRVLWVVPDERRAQRLKAVIADDRRLTADLFRVTVVGNALRAVGELP
jgi:hypothetical protein